MNEQFIKMMMMNIEQWDTHFVIKNTKLQSMIEEKPFFSEQINV